MAAGASGLWWSAEPLADPVANLGGIRSTGGCSEQGTGPGDGPSVTQRPQQQVGGR